MTQLQPFHLTNPNPWPLMMSSGALGSALFMISLFKGNLHFGLLSSSLICILLVFTLWSRDVIREATSLGDHTLQVQSGVRMGMLLFILSEVLLFFSLFWGYLHSSLSSSISSTHIWPPQGVEGFNPFELPLLNTLILLSSGLLLTLSHHSLILGDHNWFTVALILTISLGLYFTGVQFVEYHVCDFNICDGVFGSSFFIATGTHGLHVLIGSIFLMTILLRGTSGSLTTNHHFGFEASAWYWHFVDVVWLVLFGMMYWWGGPYRVMYLSPFFRSDSWPLGKPQNLSYWPSRPLPVQQEFSPPSPLLKLELPLFPQKWTFTKPQNLPPETWTSTPMWSTFTPLSPLEGCTPPFVVVNDMMPV